MNALPPLIAETSRWSIAWSRLTTSDAILLAGLILLGGTLLVLTLTRWGQVKPLSKCIFLSIFAHILLFIYLRGVPLFTEVRAKPAEHIYHVALLNPGDEAVEASSESATAAAQEPTPTDTPSPAKPDAPAPALATPAPPREPAAPALQPTTADQTESRRPSEQPRPAPPVAPELLPAQKPEPLPTPQPEPPAVVPAPRDNTPPPQLPAPQPATAPAVAMQKLAEPPAVDPQANAVADRNDQLEAAGPRDMREAPPTQPAANVGESLAGSPIAVANAAEQGSALAWRAPARVAPLNGTAARELPTLYQGRADENRRQLLQRYGGSPQGESSVYGALDWLAASQNLDGRWDARRYGAGQETKTLGQDRAGAGADAETGITALAVLAFLGAGETHLKGKHASNVQRGLEFLIRSQATDGNLAGEARLFARMYCHGMATLALSEAYALSSDARLQPFVSRAIGYTLRAQDPVGGGWRYQPGDAGDMSQLGWQVMALKSSQLAGFPVPPQTRAGTIRFLNSCVGGKQFGLASYRPQSAPSRTMTAEALTCRLFLELQRTDAAIDEAVAYLLQETPQSGEVNLYYWYYATLALFQLQGPAWETWNTALQQRLLAAQETSGEFAGSWAPDSVWGGYGGRIYSTALAALCLEVYYRYLPLYGAR